MKVQLRDWRALSDEEIHDAGGLLAEGLRAVGSTNFRSLADGFDGLTIVELRSFFESCSRRMP